MSTNKWGIDEALLRDCEGFIYRIDNTRTGQYYIGKKSFWSRVKETKKSSPKYGKRVIKESNWKDYQSSNAEVKGWAISDCEYSVLYLCGSKYELAYREIESLIECQALRDSNALNVMLGSNSIGRCPESFKIGLRSKA